MHSSHRRLVHAVCAAGVPFDRTKAEAALRALGPRHGYENKYESGSDYGPAMRASEMVLPKAKQLIILDNRRWMHSATQNVIGDKPRKMYVCFS
jgi:hypothetical protein